MADYNEAECIAQLGDKLVEMTHLNETIYSSGIAASHESFETKSGNFQCNDMLANVC